MRHRIAFALLAAALVVAFLATAPRSPRRLDVAFAPSAGAVGPEWSWPDAEPVPAPEPPPEPQTVDPPLDPVVALQVDLRDRGFDPGPIDGVLGPLTQRAERASRGIVEVPPAPPAPPAPPPPPPPFDGSIHAQPFLVCVRTHESDRSDANGNGLHDGGYQAYNPSGAAGAYQFMPGTWNSVVNAMGHPDWSGDPRSFSEDIQDQVAWWTYVNEGPSPWAGSGCY